MADDRGLLTINEVAVRLNRHPKTVRRMIRAGELPAVNINAGQERAAWRVEEAALNEWVDARRTNTG